MKIVRAMGSQENAWLRQVLGYWSMAASFVTHGVLNEDLFYEPSFSGEMFLIYAKVEPFLKELREKLQNPGLLANLEKLIHTEKGQERYKITARNVENMRKARAENLARAS